MWLLYNIVMKKFFAYNYLPVEDLPQELEG